jgi:hypothetical protein
MFIIVQILTVKVAGEGIVAEFCQELVKVSKPLMKILNLDFKKCLPTPKIPNFPKYELIAIILILAWLILLLEPFASRFSSVIMDHYYPERSKDRTVWLYQNILTKRSSFLKFARKQTKNKFLNGPEKSRSRTCCELFRAKFDNIWLCRKIFGYNREMCCVLCGSPREDE